MERDRAAADPTPENCGNDAECRRQRQQAVVRVVAVMPDPTAGTTRIDLVADPPDPPPFRFPIYPAPARSDGARSGAELVVPRLDPQLPASGRAPQRCAGGGAGAITPPPGMLQRSSSGASPTGTAPAAPPLVSYHYGFSADLGGGSYRSARELSEPATRPQGALAASNGAGRARCQRRRRCGRDPERLQIESAAGATP